MSESHLRPFRAKRRRHFPDVSDTLERREQVIATGRVLLAAGAILAAYLGRIEPARNAPVISTLLAGYLVLSVTLWFALRSKPTDDPAIHISAHVADLLCTTALTVLSHGADSPFFLFFIFVLLAAAYRWGLLGTILTAGAGVALLGGEAYALLPGSLPSRLLNVFDVRMGQELEISRLAMRCVYLLMVGVLLGYLAEGEKALQSEAAAIAHIVGKARVAGGLKDTLEEIFDEVLAAFGVGRGLVVAEEIETGRMFLWEARRSARGDRVKLERSEVAGKRQTEYRSAVKTGAWFARRTRAGEYRMAELAPETGTVERESGDFPPALLGCEKVLATPFRLGNEWQGWVYLPDAGNRFKWRKKARFLRRVVDAAVPPVYNAYLLSRMRSRIGAQERGRVARELHDGAIQSLMAAEMEMHVLRARTAGGTDGNSGPLDHVEDLIHEQVLTLRELMEKIRPIDPDPRRLPETLAEQVEKFQRETGIEATFVDESGPVRLTGRACRELVRIVQELLFNVRRHSGAGRVDVRLSSHEGTCRIEVADNGRGFDFCGRLDQAALQAARKGPRVVQERARTLGGHLEIESHPGKGARLAITIPQREE
jgi:signal transduction histidine kinase